MSTVTFFAEASPGRATAKPQPQLFPRAAHHVGTTGGWARTGLTTAVLALGLTAFPPLAWGVDPAPDPAPEPAPVAPDPLTSAPASNPRAVPPQSSPTSPPTSQAPAPVAPAPKSVTPAPATKSRTAPAPRQP